MDQKPTGPQWEEAGEDALPPSLKALCPMLPEMLYCPYNATRRRYLFRKTGKSEDWGLIAFLDPQQAYYYIRDFLHRGNYEFIRQVSLDEAHDAALAHHARVNCIIVVSGTPWRTAVHYVR